jgi:acyl-coenzyme A thioesterase PaaI-like protein
VSEIFRSDANRCFVCGPGNPIGLKLVFRLDGDICRSEFTPSDIHCGYDNVTHGGIIFSVLDDVMANWIYLKGIKAFTAKCDIRYKDSLPTGTTVQLEGQCIKQKRRLIVMRGKMTRTDNDQLVAETEASFMISRGT